MDTKGPDKKERLLAALEQGMVMIHLDARRLLDTEFELVTDPA